MADALVIDLYKATKSFPVEERFGLQSQLRRAAVSVPTNLVEGSARRSSRDYVQLRRDRHRLGIRDQYLVGVSVRLGFFVAEVGDDLVTRYGRVIRALQALVSALTEARGPRPEGPSRK